MIRLETERLTIRPFLSSDAQDLYEYLSDEQVVHFEPYNPFTLEQAEAEAIRRAGSDEFHAVCLKSSGKVIGNLYLAHGAFDTWELGYVFNRAYQNMGYATESARALIQHAFTGLGARRIVAMCHPDNTRSWKLMERLSMRREGHLIRNAGFLKDADGHILWSDTYLYAVLRAEWEAAEKKEHCVPLEWNGLSEPWKAAFMQAWTAYRTGSIPIGAALADADGNVIVTDRNRAGEEGTGNPHIAHAEAGCLRQLDTVRYPDVRTYTLYATMEPCPMCMGTLVIGNIRTVCIAARDRHCGAAHYAQEDPYIQSKNLDISFDDGLLQSVQLVLQTVYELDHGNGADNPVTYAFARTDPHANRLAHTYYSNGCLSRAAQDNASIEAVFDMIRTDLFREKP